MRLQCGCSAAAVRPPDLSRIENCRVDAAHLPTSDEMSLDIQHNLAINGRASSELHCSRHRKRYVFEYIYIELRPVFHRQKTATAKKCALEKYVLGVFDSGLSLTEIEVMGVLGA